jgi:hypothetical protein
MPNHGPMGIGFVRWPARSAQGETDEHRSRGFHVLGDLPAHDDAHGREARLFQHARDQSHGLLADRSAGYQQGGFCAGLFQPAGCRRSGLLQQLPGLGQKPEKLIAGSTRRPICPLAAN